MILVYIENPDKLGKGEPVLVLDNFDDKIKPGTERTDLLAVFLVSGDKKVTVVSDDGKKRSVKGEVDSAKFAKIDKIKKKIAENKIKYQQYNEGRPLY